MNDTEAHSAETRKSTQLASEVYTPKSYSEAKNCKDAELWMEAIQAESQALLERGTFEIIHKVPDGANIVKSKWVFKVKADPDGYIDRYKARLVAQGYTQREHLDYDPDKIFAPVVRTRTLRVILSLIIHHKLEAVSMDFSNAYLNSDIQHELYLKAAPGFNGSSGNVLLQVHKGLYGFVQSGNLWNQNVHQRIIEQGFEQLDSDNCVYVKYSKTNNIRDKDFVIIALYVDDLLIANSSYTEAHRIAKLIQGELKASEPKKLNLFTGIKLEQVNELLNFSVPVHIKDAIECAGLADAKTAETPMASSCQLQAHTPGDNDCKGPFAKIIGKLMFISGQARPDITFAVHRLARYMANPKQSHWRAVQRILKYLKSNPKASLTYGYHSNQIGKIEIYTDADYGNDPESFRSTTGFLVFFNGDLIAWESKLQRVVALSSCEAEFMALTEATKEALWIKSFLSELRLNTNGPININEDNQSAIQLVKNPTFHARTKHMNIKLNFVRDEFKKGTIHLKYCPTQDNIADILTKPLSLNLFRKHFTDLNLREPDNPHI